MPLQISAHRVAVVANPIGDALRVGLRFDRFLHDRSHGISVNAGRDRFIAKNTGPKR